MITAITIEFIPNRLTFLYSKIYYNKENYLKVITAVFKYITPPIVKVKYIKYIIDPIDFTDFINRIVQVLKEDLY